MPIRGKILSTNYGECIQIQVHFTESVVKTPEDLLNFVLMAETGGFQCSICGKAFGTRRETRCHVELIHFKHSFTYYCDHCGKEFNSLNTRNVHISRNHKKIEKQNW